MNVKLLQNLNFSDILNSCEAITEAGKEMVNTYRGYLFSNPASCSLVNGFLLEAKNYSFDSGLNSTVESINDFISKNNISWKLASVCESIASNNSTYNYIAKVGVQQVEKLLEMNEGDVISYIKAGGLKNLTYIPEVRLICKEVYKTHLTEAQAPNYTVYNPVSYVLVSEGATTFNVLGRTYTEVDGKVSETKCNDATFNRINMLLESFTKDGDDMYYEIPGIHGDKMRFTLNENGLTMSSQRINEKFENPTKFLEYCNILSKTLAINEKMGFMNVANAIGEVFEAYDHIVCLDTVKLMNSNNGTVLAIIEGKDNVNLTVFQSINAGTSSTSYDYVVEALNNVIKLTGIDLKNLFEERIDEDCKKASEDDREIREQLEADMAAQFDIRKKKIAMLAEQYKNDPVKIALLNKVAKDLSMLEQKEEVTECGDSKCTGKEDCQCKDCKKKKEEEKKDEDNKDVEETED